MENSTATFNKNAIPVRWGLILGLLFCVFTTVEFKLFSDSYILFVSSWFIGVVLAVIIYIIAAKQQRKATGGYMTFKEAFRVIFIIIVISVPISTIYGFLYFNYIDPTAMDRMGQTVVDFMERLKAPAESIDDAMAGFEESGKAVKTVSGTMMGMLKTIIINAIIGFICAAIVKKNKPEFAA